MAGRIVQECGVGLIELRHHDGRLAFAAPPLIRSGGVESSDLVRVCRVLAIDPSAVVDAQWVDNGPGWVAILLESADAVLAVTPDFGAEPSFDIGVVGPTPIGVLGRHSDDALDRADPSDRCAIEVRAFFRAGGQAAEDPVTGSLNASLAQWLIGSGRLHPPYVASQGTALGRAGRVHIDRSGETIWVGGDAVTCVDGAVQI
jgi:predicted PhzF superfamily epimerase YddE/YHI9